MTTLLLWPLRPPAAWILGLFILLGWLLLAVVDLFDDLVPMALALIFGFELPLWYLLLGSLCLAAQMGVLREIRATHPAFAATEQFRNLVLSIRDR